MPPSARPSAAAAAAAGKAGSPPSPIAEGGFALSGASEHPDPATHAYRQDLADVALAGRVVASHYAEPLVRLLGRGCAFLSEPDDASERIGTLQVGDELRMLDCSRGWAWGYAPDGRVGYVRSDALVS